MGRLRVPSERFLPRIIADVRPISRGQRTEDREQRTENRGQDQVSLSRNGVGLVSIAPSIRRTSEQSATSSVWSSGVMKQQSFAKSRDVSVSLLSPSQSVSLLMKCDS